MDNNTYIIWDNDNGELIQVHTKITIANCTHNEVVQMIMQAQSCDVKEWAEYDIEDLNFKVYAIYGGNQYPLFEDDLTTYTFEDKHYIKMCEARDAYLDDLDAEDEEDNDDSEDTE